VKLRECSFGSFGERSRMPSTTEGIAHCSLLLPK